MRRDGRRRKLIACRLGLWSGFWRLLRFRRCYDLRCHGTGGRQDSLRLLLCLLSGGFDAYEGGCGKECDGNDYNGGQAATGSCKGLAERNVVEKPLDAAGEGSTAGHGNSYEGWARCCREFEQDLRVGCAIGGLFKASAVADGFSQAVDGTCQSQVLFGSRAGTKTAGRGIVFAELLLKLLYNRLL